MIRLLGVLGQCSPVATLHRCHGMQDMMVRLMPYTDSLDASNALGQPATPLLARTVYHRVGARFTSWLAAERRPLQDHTATVRAAARFSTELAREIRDLDDHAELQVRPSSVRVLRCPRASPRVSNCAGSQLPTRSAAVLCGVDQMKREMVFCDHIPSL